MDVRYLEASRLSSCVKAHGDLALRDTGDCEMGVKTFQKES